MARKSLVFPQPDGPSMDRHSVPATANERGGSVPTFNLSTLSKALSHRSRLPRQAYQASEIFAIRLWRNAFFSTQADWLEPRRTLQQPARYSALRGERSWFNSGCPRTRALQT